MGNSYCQLQHVLDSKQDLKERLTALERFAGMDVAEDEGLKRLVKVAAQTCGGSRAFVSFIDNRYQWLKVQHGFDVDCFPLDVSVCRCLLEEGGGATL